VREEKSIHKTETLPRDGSRGRAAVRPATPRTALVGISDWDSGGSEKEGQWRRMTSGGARGGAGGARRRISTDGAQKYRVRVWGFCGDSSPLGIEVVEGGRGGGGGSPGGGGGAHREVEDRRQEDGASQGVRTPGSRAPPITLPVT
jgi:hypothetical protein